MAVSRRKLLQNSFVALAACAASPFPLWATGKKASGTIENAGLQHLNRKAFEAQIGSGFQVTALSGKGSSVWMRLLAVSDLPKLVPQNVAAMAVPPKQKSAQIHTIGFMLSFLGTLPKPLAQDTYNFEHAALGKFPLLIVPEGHGADTYIAVINRL